MDNSKRSLNNSQDPAVHGEPLPAKLLSEIHKQMMKCETNSKWECASEWAYWKDDRSQEWVLNRMSKEKSGKDFLNNKAWEVKQNDNVCK